MIAETTILIEGKNEEGFFPLRRRSQGFVDLLDEGLTLSDGGRRMERLVGAAVGIEVGERG